MRCWAVWAGTYLAVAVFLALAGAAPGGLELTVRPALGGRPLARALLRPGERFTLRYYHSVEEAPIWEEHSVDAAGRIYIEEERYLRFGAGMGRMPGVGRLLRRGPFEVIADMHQPTGRFVLRVGGGNVRHTLLWRDKAVNLSAMAAGRPVRFAARPVSLLYWWWREWFPPGK